ncbi:MAG TPA: hypothetical protein VGD43_22370 [Micromonospora sp.]
MTGDHLPDPFAGQPEWVPRPPRPIVLAPIAGRMDLRGRRVVVGLPGIGWRADLRADERVVQGSRTYVPVIPEHEWYRAEAEQIEVFAPLVPAERVWVETVGAAVDSASTSGGDVVSRLVSLDVPTHRPPVPVLDADSVSGRRVVQMVDSVEQRDLRAVTEMHTSANGDICVRVTTEMDWYRWSWSGQTPKTQEAPVHLLWVE